jgi:hypothetical protein
MANPPETRDPRRFIYAGLDFGFGLLYAVLFLAVIPNRVPSAAALLWSLVAAVVIMGGAMVAGRRGGRWAWRSAVGAAALLLVLTVVLLIAILMSAAFLSGVYGAFGRAASTFSLLAAALVIELVALLPAFQLKFLMTRAGRRAFGLPPVGR